MTRLVRGIAALTLAFAASMVISAPANAAGESVVVRQVDSTLFPEVGLTVMTSRSMTEGVHLRENGKRVDGAVSRSLLGTGTEVGIVVVVDSSATMDSTSGFNEAKEAVEAVIAARQGNQKIALVASGGTARTIVNFTTDARELREGLARIVPAGSSNLWDGLGVATRMLSEQNALQPNILLISGSNDSGSESGSYERVRSDVRQSGTALFGATLKRQHADTDKRIAVLSSESGARTVETDDAGDLTGMARAAHESISSQRVVTYQSQTPTKLKDDSEPVALDIEVFVGDVSAVAHTRSDTVSQGFALKSVPFETPPPRPNAIQQLGGVPTRAAISGVAFLGIGLLALVLAGLLVKDRSELSQALHMYPRLSDADDITRLSDSEILGKPSATERKSNSSKQLTETIQIRLEQADIPLRPMEAVSIFGGVFVSSVLLAYMLSGKVAAFLIAVAAVATPPLLTNYLVRRRHKRFVKQLPDVFHLIAGSLRIGHSLPQALDAISKEVDDPWGIELQRVTTEARLGRSIDDALEAMALRMQSEDFTWAVMAIRIQRRVGGNLAELLTTIADTVVTRARLRREVKALTAEARISAIVLSVLPPLVAAAITLVNPGYMEPLTSNLFGQVVLGCAGVLMVFGYLVMRKLGAVQGVS